MKLLSYPNTPSTVALISLLIWVVAPLHHVCPSLIKLPLYIVVLGIALVAALPAAIALSVHQILHPYRIPFRVMRAPTEYIPL